MCKPQKSPHVNMSSKTSQFHLLFIVQLQNTNYFLKTRLLIVTFRNSFGPSGGRLTGIGSSPIRILLALLLSFSQACASSASAAAEVKCGGVGRSCNTKCKRKNLMDTSYIGHVCVALQKTYFK